MTDQQRCRAFLREPIWGAGTPQWRDWWQRCEKLGRDAAPVFLAALEDGDAHEQYAALYALRVLGYEVYEEGGPAPAHVSYRVRRLDEPAWRVIVPRICPLPWLTPP
jgi:hypothetical protein